MPRKNSPPPSRKRSPPARRHISPTSQGIHTQIPSHPSGTTPGHLRIGDPSPVSQPSWSQTILQSSTLAVEPPPYLPDVSVDGSPSTSSRRPSTSSMRNASMTFETVAPTATPTGRVSKAKKGKRVHACEFPGCGKVFTRAEHRRRHELNHNPEALYPCRQPGCGKAFHRVDLLQRHQERHDLEASTGSASSHSRHMSQNSALSSPPSMMPSTAMTSPAITESAPRTSSGALSIGSLVNPQSHHHYATDPSLAGFGIQGISYMPTYSSVDDPYFYASESSQSPRSEFSRFPHRQSISSASSVAAFDPSSGSPMISTSLPGWIPSTAPPMVLPPNMFEQNATHYVTSSTATSMPIPLSELDGYEWTVIQRELSCTAGLLFDNDRHGISDTIRWQCLENYWQYFHPSFPVVHRPTFLPTKPSPLLASAMLAIGSYYDQRKDAKIYSMALLEIATKLLCRRQNITSRSRIVDLQTVLLLEILSKYCARHISVTTSSRFRALFASLDQARQWLASSPLAVFRTLKQSATKEDLAKAHKFWVEHETRRRVFHACSVLDAQQTALFEQPATIVNHDNLRVSTGETKTNIQLPCDDELWCASPVEEWAKIAGAHQYRDLATARANYSESSVNDYSFFQHQIINANMKFAQRCLEENSSPPTSQSILSRTRFNYHVFEMTRYTPVRQLLIIAGESWILGRKVESELEYSQAKLKVRHWVSNSATTTPGTTADTLMALWHALKILRMLVAPGEQAEMFQTTYMLHENWAAYLATLVCWVHGYRRGFISPVPSNSSGSGGSAFGDSNNSEPSISGTPPTIATPNSSSGNYNRHRKNTSATSTPSANSNRHPALLDSYKAAQDMQAYLRHTDVRTPRALRNLNPAVLGRTQGLLEMVRTRKFSDSLMGGLMNDAERVLYRLIDGTNSNGNRSTSSSPSLLF